jgi:rhamnulokinase
VIFPDDPRLLNPDSMLRALARQLGETGQRMPGTPAAIARMVLDSLGLRYASVLRGIQNLTDSLLGRVRIVGGGSRNEYLNRATAAFAGIPVVAGPVEATVLGNAAVQAVAAGRFPSLTDARRDIGTYTASLVCEPSAALADDGLSERYAGIEALFTT